MNDIMKNIKRLRQRKGLTQEELGAKLHVTRQAVSNWETGKNQPDIEILKSLAETLEVDVSELLYAPKPDVDRQRRIITAALLCVLTFAAWVIFYVLRRRGNYLQSARYDTRLNVFLLMVVRPTAFLLLGAAAGALLSVWRNLHPTTVRMRQWILAIGWGFLLTYLIMAIVSLYGSRLFYGWMWWGRNQPWTFLLPGALLFCGSRRKAG
ncbi:MAG: helix-turn-helix transcriptional regulator [Oscillospiraceae bacterium]|jgi:transcriptional regulator with XRE-family HTH domain|nr:helix-turn-helix transcriptional regulator [Oscillospiraceae bacterium]